MTAGLLADLSFQNTRRKLKKKTCLLTTCDGSDDHPIKPEGSDELHILICPNRHKDLSLYSVMMKILLSH